MRNSTKDLIARYETLAAFMKLENGITQFECKTGFNREWIACTDSTNPIWPDLDYCEFRVKPKPVEAWAWKYPSGNITNGGEVYVFDQKQLNDISGKDRVMVLLREVTE